jgi:CRP-like cAMP-binding protein
VTKTSSPAGARARTLAAAREILTRHSVFGILTPGELDQLLAHAHIESYPGRQVIFAKGSPGRGLFIVLTGQVRISSGGAEGDEIVLNIIGEGDVFGEIALLDGRERSADAMALGDCALLAVDRRDFMPFLRANPDAALRLLGVLCYRLRRSTELIEDILFLESPARIAKKLLDLLSTPGPSAPGAEPRGAAPPRIGISQHELGRMLGLSRESINKQLSAWQRAGVIKVERAAITILDEAALRDRAEPSYR